MNKSDKLLKQVKDGYNQIADHFAQTRNAPWSEFDLFKEYISKGQKILDIGCAHGRIYNFLKTQNLGVDYHGLDVSENLIKIGQEKYPEIADKFKAGDMSELPYKDNQFDVVISIATFHHLPNKELRLKALSEIRRVLKPDGYLLMTNWHMWHQPFLKHFFLNLGQKVSYKDMVFPWKSAEGISKCQRYYHAFTKHELKALFKKSGFKIQKIFLHFNSKKKTICRGIDIISLVKK